MILTGSAIVEAVRQGDISIDPFSPANVNPNSYNYRLGEEILRVVATPPQLEPPIDRHAAVRFEPVSKRDGRCLLQKRSLYLGHTLEVIGSKKHITSLIGRSSMGRLGLFVQLSANIGHNGAIHRWTLELFPALDIYVYPGQVIGQVSFWTCEGQVSPYSGWYGQYSRPMPSRFHTMVARRAGGSAE